MVSYILKRLLMALPVLLGVSILAFLLVRLVPGDTVTAMLGLHHTPEAAERLRQTYGLDRPLVYQYVIWLSRVLRGDLGQSIFMEQPVSWLILDRLPVTLQLAGMSLLFAIVIGIPLGIVAALCRARPGDHAASVLGLAGISIPGFWLGTLLILAFSLHLDWLPSGGFRRLTQDPAANLEHMLLPVLALGTAVMAVIMRMARSAMLEVIRQDYIRTARAKGVGEWTLIVRHALRNALIPILTIAGLQAGYLIGGSVVIEQVFALPGIGRLALDAIASRDYPLLQGVILFVGASFVLINLLVDVLYAVLDPRIQYGSRPR